MSPAVNGLVFVALYVVAGAAARAQAPPNVSSLRVSPATVAAAEVPAVERFAAALALENVPAGFVLGAHEATVGPVAALRPQDGARVPLPSALDRFLATHPGYVVGQSDWGLVIQPRSQTICHAALRTVVTGASIAEPAYAAFWKLARLVNPADTPNVPPGLVCGGGDCNSGLPPAHRVHVAVTLNGITLQDALSQVVAQAPGMVWVLRDRRRERDDPAVTPEAACQLGYFDRDLYLQTSYVFAKAPAGGQ